MHLYQSSLWNKGNNLHIFVHEARGMCEVKEAILHLCVPIVTLAAHTQLLFWKVKTKHNG